MPSRSDALTFTGMKRCWRASPDHALTETQCRQLHVRTEKAGQGTEQTTSSRLRPDARPQASEAKPLWNHRASPGAGAFFV